jgi:hypothetical protein
MRRVTVVCLVLLAAGMKACAAGATLGAAGSPATSAPGQRVLLDAHNAYPYEGRFSDRMARALSTGVPLAIEPDIAWCPTSPGHFEPVVAHDTACRGDEPSLQHYFIDSVRATLDEAADRPSSADWPLITLNLDSRWSRRSCCARYARY